MAKHKFASISLTVQDRAISSKFSTHRVSKECTLCNFQKIFPSPKMAAILNFRQKWQNTILLRKIALPYPHKCLFGFVEQNVSTDKNFLRNILVTRGDPFVCACPRMRRTHCRQAIVERSSLYFWSIWEQHVFSFIIVHLQTKIYEVLKRASVHLPVVVHYWTGTTTNSTSLVLKKVRIKMFYTRNLAVKSSAEDVIRLHSPSIRLELPACRGKGCKKSLLWSFQWETKKKEFSYLYNGGRRFFTVGGAPPWYSNRSPSKRTTTDMKI